MKQSGHRAVDAVHSIICALVGIGLVIIGKWELGLAVLVVIGCWELCLFYRQQKRGREEAVHLPQKTDQDIDKPTSEQTKVE